MQVKSSDAPRSPHKQQEPQTPKLVNPTQVCNLGKTKIKGRNSANTSLACLPKTSPLAKLTNKRSRLPSDNVKRPRYFDRAKVAQ